MNQSRKLLVINQTSNSLRKKNSTQYQEKLIRGKQQGLRKYPQTYGGQGIQLHTTPKLLYSI